MNNDQEEKVFRVWVFDRYESTESYEYDDEECTISYDIQGAEITDLTKQELADLRVGLANVPGQTKALLVCDLRKQNVNTYAKTVSDLIQIGVDAQAKYELAEKRRLELAVKKAAKNQAGKAEKKRKQLEKLQKELAELES